MTYPRVIYLRDYHLQCLLVVLYTPSNYVCKQICSITLVILIVHHRSARKERNESSVVRTEAGRNTASS